MEKKWLNTLEAARLINPKCTEGSARTIMHNLVMCGTVTKHYPQLAIIENGEVQTINKKIQFFDIDDVKKYIAVKGASIKSHSTSGFKLRAEREGYQDLTFTSMLDAAAMLQCSYRELRYCVKKGGGIIGEYKISLL